MDAVTEQFKLRAWRQLTIPPSNTILTSSCTVTVITAIKTLYAQFK